MSQIRLGHVVVVYNTNAAMLALSEGVADYYIAAHGLNTAHKYGIDFGGGATTGWTLQECYDNFISDLADYIDANDIDAVFLSSGVPVLQAVDDVANEYRSLSAMAGFAPWQKALGHVPTSLDYRFFHTVATPSADTPRACTITQANPGSVTYVSGAITSNLIVVLETDGTLPAPLEPGKHYYAVGVDVLNKTLSLALTASGTPIETTSAGAGNHTIKIETLNSALDMDESTETYGAASSLLHHTKKFDWRGNAYWRPHGYIGYPYSFGNGGWPTFATVKRIIDDAIASEGIVRAPIHVHQYSRIDPYISALQGERARVLLDNAGIETRHNATCHVSSNSSAAHSYSASWPIQPPADSYGNWGGGEYANNPFSVGGLVSPAVANAAAGDDWLDSFNPVRGAWMLNPTSLPAPSCIDFMVKGGCAGHATTGEPYATNQPNAHTFIARLLDGMTWAEAMVLSTPVGGHKNYAIGDPLYRPLRGVKKLIKTVLRD